MIGRVEGDLWTTDISIQHTAASLANLGVGEKDFVLAVEDLGTA